MGASADIELARMMPAGDRRQNLVREWLGALMPWIDVESSNSEEYLIGRWKARFGDMEDGQQPK